MARVLNTFSELTSRELDLAHTILNIVAQCVARSETDENIVDIEKFKESLSTALGVPRF